MRRDQVPDLPGRQGHPDFLIRQSVSGRDKDNLNFALGDWHSYLRQQGRFQEGLIWERRPGTQFCCDGSDAFAYPGVEGDYVRLVFKRDIRTVSKSLQHQYIKRTQKYGRVTLKKKDNETQGLKLIQWKY